MNPVLYFFSWLIQTMFRISPFPAKTGLIKIGSPDPSSPVFLTCNFLLSVQRLKRALRGMNVYILVANTHGMNVWCGAAGGHFTHHSVISVIKTTGVEDLVHHRKVILPQLAAAGVEAKKIKEKSGWTVIWGPVHTKDIKAFMQNKQTKTDAMSVVSFPLFHRIEMAVFWALPISLFLNIPVFFFFPHLLLITNLIIWGLSFLILISFPLYGWLLEKEKHVTKKPSMSFTGIGIQLLLFLLITCGFFVFHLTTGIKNRPLLLQARFLQEIVLTVLIVFIITIDLKGLTPLFFSGFLDKGYRVNHDKSKCRGDGICIDVCPKNCFIRTNEKPWITISLPDSCISCGACIVQCPHNALCFVSSEGKEILPDEIRKTKLTLTGKRGPNP
jgi:NAD-dependent dihydropyrimidine dehydrogenase PreA subunit